MSESVGLLSAFCNYVGRAKYVKSAVLFGSNAARRIDCCDTDSWSDYDIHIVSSDVRKCEQVDWSSELPNQGFRFQVIRPATGGVRKVTVFFAGGQLDLVVVPRYKLNLATLAFRLGLYPSFSPLRVGLDEIHTCIRSGYRFLKGESAWRPFYSAIERDVRGIRIDDEEISRRVTIAAAELVWIIQKVRRGELCAAQRQLHCSLGDTNFVLLRELRLRSGRRMQSFGLARKIETLATAEEFSWVQINARLDGCDIVQAAWRSFEGCQQLVRKMIPDFKLPDPILDLLNAYKDCTAASNRGS